MTAMGVNAKPGPSGSKLPVNLVGVGAVPGVLDPSQKARILTEEHSTLLFATQDIWTAGGHEAALKRLQKVDLNDRNVPKRIVVEVTRTGQSTWRYVPSARKEEGVENEGNWPRVIDICGTLVYCSQEQWEIYKLDRYYDCLVRKYPAITAIRPRHLVGREADIGPTPLGKRSYDNISGDGMQEGPNKRVHRDRDVTMESIRSGTVTEDEADGADGEEEEDDEDDEEELVAEMVTQGWQSHRTPRKPSAGRPKHSPATPRLRPPLTPRAAKPVSQAAPPTAGPSTPAQPARGQSVPPDSGKKRKDFASDLEPGIVKEEEEEVDLHPRRKRVNFERTERSERRNGPSNPPYPTQREIRTKRREREEQKRKRWEQEQQARIREREERVMREAMEGVPQPPPTQGKSFFNFQPYAEPGIDRDSSMRGFSDFEDDLPKPESRAFTSEEEAARQAAIEESRRKLQELEADRPLWEQAAKERRAQEEAKEAEERAKVEAKRRQEQDDARQRAERLRREQQEAEDHARREQEKKDAERARQAQDRQTRKARWSSGRWTTARAVERFKETSDYFDTTRFSEEHPLFVDDVPWPTLRHPDVFSLPEDVDWDSVEHFFEVLKTHMRTQEYVALVEKSHRRFHPDRWRSRGLFRAVPDPEQRDYMEIAATTVSQALTPIWQKVRSLKQA